MGLHRNDNADAKTPMMVGLCSECGRPLLLLANWLPAPETPEEAGQGLGAHLCVAAADSLWHWCPFTVPPTLLVH